MMDIGLMQLAALFTYPSWNTKEQTQFYPHFCQLTLLEKRFEDVMKRERSGVTEVEYWRNSQ